MRSTSAILGGMLTRLTSLPMDAGILPVKRLDAAKSRLEVYFDAGQRAALASAMLEDALDLCRAAHFLRWHVLSTDPAVLQRAEAAGLAVLEDPPGGDLNSSLRHAIGALGGRAASVTIVPVDAPMTTPAELQDLVDTGSVSDIVVVPAERDAGTNGLFLSPPGLMEPRFGESSFSAYVTEAEAAELRCSILPLAGLGVDIDTEEDILRVVSEASRETRAVELLRKWVRARD